MLGQEAFGNQPFPAQLNPRQRTFLQVAVDRVLVDRGNLAPRPLHRGMPTLHFDKLTCTACHSGPMPEDATTLVQTAMSHKLGLPRHHTADAEGWKYKRINGRMHINRGKGRGWETNHRYRP